MSTKDLVIAGLGVAALYFYLKCKKDKTPTEVQAQAMTQAVVDAAQSVANKTREAFTEAVRKDYDIIVPPAQVSKEVWAEVDKINAERAEDAKLNIKQPVYI